MTDLHLPDVNVLVALLHSSHVFHEHARQWFMKTKRFATTPITEIGFLRVALNPAVMGTETRSEDALASLRSLRAHTRAEFLPDETSLSHAMVDLIGFVGHRQTTDLHLVNLAVTRNARLVTLDKRIRSVLSPRDQKYVVELI